MFPNDIYRTCPICNRQLDGVVYPFGTASCPNGHYQYHSLGSYASAATIIFDGRKEDFHFNDDVCFTSENRRLEMRVDEIRNGTKLEWRKEGF